MELTGGVYLSVTTLREREARAVFARAELEWAGLRPSFRSVHCAVSFSFSFVQFLLDI
jgi:hypothetical protein